MGNYTFRAMEIHDFTQIWNLDEIRRRLDFMVKNHMNAMVFHEPGIEDKIVFPAKFLGGTGNPKSYYDAFLEVDHPILNHALRENLNLNRRDYINHVIQEAKEAGVDIYFENKELWFSDFVLKYKKELMQPDGTICPSDPFWHEEFLPYKYKELFLALPDLAGQKTDENELLLTLPSAEAKNETMKMLAERFDIDEMRVFEPSLGDIFVEYAGD